MQVLEGTFQAQKQLFWARFRANRLGYWSFCILVVLTVLSLGAEVISNDRPLAVRYAGEWYFPVVQDLPETVFGGDFESPTDFHDPFIREQLEKPENWVLFPVNDYGFKTLNYFRAQPNPAPPSADNVLGTDRQGRDMVALLIYGFRVSMLFALVLTVIGAVVGVLIGAVQGYFAGKVDLIGQRLIEIWEAMPMLYLLIIFSSIFKPSILILVLLLSLFSWIGLSAYTRAEFLRNRQLDYVRAARALGVSHGQIIWRHVLPNSLMPVITFVPFIMGGAMVTLTSLDFLGLGVPPETPSLGALLQQGKKSLDAWWISLPTFGVLFVTLMLLTFTGDALRNALDPRYQGKKKKQGNAGKAEVIGKAGVST
ncbi:MAG: ABC transporter permease [Saezia sp.]